MSKKVEPVSLPSIPKSARDQDLLDYLAKLNNSLQDTFDQLTTLANNGLIPYSTVAMAQAVTSGAVTQTETISPAFPTGTTYSAIVVTSWLTTWDVTTKTLSGFNVNFGTAAPSGGGKIDVWVVTNTPQ